MLGNWLKTTVLMAAIVALFGAIGGYLGGANGMIMALVALFNQQPKASDEEIRHALSGHLCRCGTHVEIMQAAARARELIAKGHSPALPAAGASTTAKAA